MDRKKDTQELTKNTTNNRLKASSQTVCQGHADRPCGAQTAARTRPLEGQHHLPTTRSPKWTKGLLPNHRWRWSASRRCYTYKFVASNPMNWEESRFYQAQEQARFPTEILQSEGEFGVWGIKIKHKDTWGNYPWFPPTNLKPNTSESKEQSAHKKPTKIAQKRHEHPTSYKSGIDATMKASIHSEVRFFRNRGKI
jgi:hypothetical protein